MPFQKGNKIQPRKRKGARPQKLTRKAAIKAKCTDCICDSSDIGTPLQQITGCQITDCPLWEWRPKSPAPLPERLKTAWGIT